MKSLDNTLDLHLNKYIEGRPLIVTYHIPFPKHYRLILDSSTAFHDVTEIQQQQQLTVRNATDEISRLSILLEQVTQQIRTITNPTSSLLKSLASKQRYLRQKIDDIITLLSNVTTAIEPEYIEYLHSTVLENAIQDALHDPHFITQRFSFPLKIPATLDPSIRAVTKRQFLEGEIHVEFLQGTMAIYICPAHSDEEWTFPLSIQVVHPQYNANSIVIDLPVKGATTETPYGGIIDQNSFLSGLLYAKERDTNGGSAHDGLTDISAAGPMSPSAMSVSSPRSFVPLADFDLNLPSEAFDQLHEEAMSAFSKLVAGHDQTPTCSQDLENTTTTDGTSDPQDTPAEPTSGKDENDTLNANAQYCQTPRDVFYEPRKDDLLNLDANEDVYGNLPPLSFRFYFGSSFHDFCDYFSTLKTKKEEIIQRQRLKVELQLIEREHKSELKHQEDDILYEQQQQHSGIAVSSYNPAFNPQDGELSTPLLNPQRSIIMPLDRMHSGGVYQKDNTDLHSIRVVPLSAPQHGSLLDKQPRHIGNSRTHNKTNTNENPDGGDDDDDDDDDDDHDSDSRHISRNKLQHLPRPSVHSPPQHLASPVVPSRPKHLRPKKQSLMSMIHKDSPCTCSRPRPPAHPHLRVQMAFCPETDFPNFSCLSVKDIFVFAAENRFQQLSIILNACSEVLGVNHDTLWFAAQSPYGMYNSHQEVNGERYNRVHLASILEQRRIPDYLIEAQLPLATGDQLPHPQTHGVSTDLYDLSSQHNVLYPFGDMDPSIQLDDDVKKVITTANLQLQQQQQQQLQQGIGRFFSLLDQSGHFITIDCYALWTLDQMGHSLDEYQRYISSQQQEQSNPHSSQGDTMTKGNNMASSKQSSQLLAIVEDPTHHDDVEGHGKSSGDKRQSTTGAASSPPDSQFLTISRTKKTKDLFKLVKQSSQTDLTVKLPSTSGDTDAASSSPKQYEGDSVRFNTRRIPLVPMQMQQTPSYADFVDSESRLLRPVLSPHQSLSVVNFTSTTKLQPTSYVTPNTTPRASFASSSKGATPSRNHHPSQIRSSMSSSLLQNDHTGSLHNLATTRSTSTSLSMKNHDMDLYIIPSNDMNDPAIGGASRASSSSSSAVPPLTLDLAHDGDDNNDAHQSTNDDTALEELEYPYNIFPQAYSTITLSVLSCCHIMSNLNATDLNGWTPLLYAAYLGHLDSVKILLRHGADVHFVARDGATPLYVALDQCHFDVVDFLITYGGVNPHIIDPRTHLTPLMFTAKTGNLLATDHLIRVHRPNLNAMTHPERFTALAWATINNHIKIVDMLIVYCVNLNVQSAEGYTALMLACRDNHHRLAELLISNQAHLNTYTHTGITALTCAIHNQNYPLTQLLLEKHANPNPMRHRSVITPLIAAVLNRDMGIISLLLDYGAKLNDIDSTGQTALMHACGMSEATEFVNFLVNRGSDLNLRDNEGKTAMVVASENQNHHIVRFLFSKGGKKFHLYAKSNDALQTAVVRCNKRLLDKILSDNGNVNLHLNMKIIQSLIPKSSNQQHSILAMTSILMNECDYSLLMYCIEKDSFIIGKDYHLVYHDEDQDSRLIDRISGSGSGSGSRSRLTKSSSTTNSISDDHSIPSQHDHSIVNHSSTSSATFGSSTSQSHHNRRLSQYHLRDNISLQMPSTQQQLSSPASPTAAAASPDDGRLGSFLPKSLRPVASSSGIPLPSFLSPNQAKTNAGNGVGFRDLIDVLLKHDVDVNDYTNIGGITALMIAAKHNRKDLCRVLLKANANLNATDNMGNTPAKYARSYGHDDLADWLVRQGGRE